VPVGLPGELYLGGAGVGRGYHNRPALTAGSFVPDPFSGQPGARLFRTGDLVRWRPDGQLLFLGRLDFQAKIRGFRVEPGEVEAAIIGHPEVREARVVARGGAGGESRLDAYVVPRDGEPVSPGVLRAFLRDRLPGHMIPSSFTTLKSLPLTSTG